MSGFSENVVALKWLRDHHYGDLSKWEQQFLDDVLDRVENGAIHSFTPKQDDVIDAIWRRLR